MAEFDYLQQIIGASRKNQLFTVFRHSQTEDYHVYYGAELFEIVPSDHEDTRFKLMVAHLRSMGVTLTKLHETFQIDPRTITHWCQALKSGDADQLARALAGHQCGRKLTAAAKEYVRVRFDSIYAQDRRSYSSKIREELKRVFKIEVSGETLRPLFRQLKAQFDQSEPSEESRDDDNDTEAPACDSDAQQECCQSVEVQAVEQPDQDPFKPSEAIDEGEPGAPEYRKSYAEFSRSCWCSHLGLLLFSDALISLSDALGKPERLPVCQWTAQVLLGAHNLEQTKLQSGHDLSLLLGTDLLGGPDHQRKKLAELAEDPRLSRDILRWNFGRVGGQKMSDFYFDPHVKHYTGKQNVLKGWCPKIRWADKIINSDYVHSIDGHPLYLENTDNYEDMRQRFKQLEGRFRDTLEIDPDRQLTWVIDRGIFSQEIFEWVLDSPAVHLITWEKGYERGGWKPGKAASASMEMQRCRNHKADQRTYHFQWIEQPWPKNPRVRRFIVKATNPEGNQIEVSILCDDCKRPAQEVIWLMFDRWVQENDFKYLDEHFGINQITSYQSETYASIRAELTDREVKNAAYQALLSARGDEKTRMGKLLVLQKQSEAAERDRAQTLAALEALASPSAEERKQLGRLRGAQKSARKHSEKREAKIEVIEKEIERLNGELEKTDKEASRLDTLIARKSVRLCGERKYLMDVIKITARNTFYEAFAPFREAYDNYRDDHVWFRHLSYSAGVIAPAADGASPLQCSLIGVADFPKTLRKVICQILEKMNRSIPRLLDGSRRQIQLVLGSKATIELANPNA